MALSVAYKLPESEDGRVKTLNEMGYMHETNDEYNRSYLEYITSVKKPVLDIGAAYGASVFAALKKGATVIANDMDGRHLAILRQNTPRHLLNRLTLKVGKFPTKLDFPTDSLSAILCSQLVHFLTPEELEIGVEKMFDWLEPGGKAFTISGSPYMKMYEMYENYVSVYELRKKNGEKWPGFIKDALSFSPSKYYPTGSKYIHLLDENVLARCFLDAGFKIEKSSIFARKDFPEEVQFDGRENVGVIAVKPL